MRRSAMFHGIMLTAFVLSRAFLGLVLGLTFWSVIPMAFQWQPTVVMSGSMEPNIMTGDIVIADPITQQEIESGLITEGHVLLARDPAGAGGLFTHRVIRILPDGSYMTKGDANAQADKAFVQPKDILGIERLRVPYIGIPVRETKMGNMTPGIIFVLLLTASVSLVQADRKRYSEQDGKKSEVVNGGTPSKSSVKPVGAILLLLMTLGATITPIMHYQGSAAFFSAYTATDVTRFTAASAFPLLGDGGTLLPLDEPAKIRLCPNGPSGAAPITIVDSSLPSCFKPVLTK